MVRKEINLNAHQSKYNYNLITFKIDNKLLFSFKFSLIYSEFLNIIPVNLAIIYNIASSSSLNWPCYLLVAVKTPSILFYPKSFIGTTIIFLDL